MEYIIKVLYLWSPFADNDVRDAWQNSDLVAAIREGWLKPGTFMCKNPGVFKALTQSVGEWKLSINKQEMLGIMTALLGTEGELHVEMVLSFHPSLPLCHSLIPPSHLGGAEIARLLHSYKLTPNKTCPQWLLAPHRVWLKLFCLGTAGVHKVTAHSEEAHNGSKTVDCMEPLEKYALIALMARNIDTPAICLLWGALRDFSHALDCTLSWSS